MSHPASFELRDAVAWVRVSAAEVSYLAMQRAHLAEKEVKPELLVELGVMAGDTEIDLRNVLRDEARRMAGVCEADDALSSYLVKWVKLCVRTPSRRTRKTQRCPARVTEEAIVAHATYHAEQAANPYWAEERVWAAWEASLP